MVKTPMPTSRLGRAEMVVAILLIAGSFTVMVMSDVSEGETHLYWIMLVVVFGAVSFLVDRVHSGRSVLDLKGGHRVLLHWIGMIAAIQLAHFFVQTGRMANADAGLTKGLLLGLGVYLAGVYGNWRLLVVGVAVAVASACIAVFEQYVWVLLGIAVFAIVLLVFGASLVRRFGNAEA